MSLNSLKDVYVEMLKDMYSSEKQLTEALPKMVEAASSAELKSAFRSHHEKTKTHLYSIHNILLELEENPTNTVCKAMEGLIEEGDEVAKEDGDAAAKDAALIVAAQKVEHYEIASYGGLRSMANSLGYTKAGDTLQEILDDEYDADQELDDLAEGVHTNAGLNVAA